MMGKRNTYIFTSFASADGCIIDQKQGNTAVQAICMFATLNDVLVTGLQRVSSVAASGHRALALRTSPRDRREMSRLKGHHRVIDGNPAASDAAFSKLAAATGLAIHRLFSTSLGIISVPSSSRIAWDGKWDCNY